MRVRFSVGSVTVDLSGVDLTNTQIRSLLNRAASIALAVDQPEEPEPDKSPLGFAAPILERAEPLAPESRFTDDRPTPPSHASPRTSSPAAG